MPRRSVLHVHSVLLQMIRQDFTLPKGANGPGKERSHIWEVRHAGLLGIKYEVAVRSDVVEAEEVAGQGTKAENTTVVTSVGAGLVVMAEHVEVDVGQELGPDVKMEVIQENLSAKTETFLRESGPRHILQDVVDAAVLG
jgi:hypothetical protein